MKNGSSVSSAADHAKEALARHKSIVGMRPAYQPRYAPPVDGPPAVRPTPPTPIKIGYYYNEATGKTETPNLYAGERHLLAFGLNGAGKSTRFLVELLMTAAGRSLVVYDMKGELAAQTAAERRRYGRVVILNPYQLHTDLYPDLVSAGFNPLKPLNPDSEFFYSDVSALAHALIEIDPGETQKHWPEGAQGLVMALIMWEVRLAKREGRTPSLFNVRMMLTEPEEYARGPDGKQRLVKGLRVTAARMIDSGDEQIKSLIEDFGRTQGLGELAGLANAAKVPTRWLIDRMIRADLEKDGLDFSRLRTEPTTVYILLPSTEMEEFRPWARVVISAALRAQYRAGPIGTLFVLDEFFAALGHLRIFGQIWGQIRQFKTQFLPIFQSVTQLETLFQKNWDIFASQAGVTFTVGPAGDLETAEWMSRRSGMTTVLQAGFNEGAGVSSGEGINAGANFGQNTTFNQGGGRNYGESINSSMSYQSVERRFLLPQELMDLAPGMGRMWLPGWGSLSIPFFAPNYWKRREPWVARVRPNPYPP